MEVEMDMWLPINLSLVVTTLYAVCWFFSGRYAMACADVLVKKHQVMEWRTEACANLGSLLLSLGVSAASLRAFFLETDLEVDVWVDAILVAFFSYYAVDLFAQYHGGRLNLHNKQQRQVVLHHVLIMLGCVILYLFKSAAPVGSGTLGSRLVSRYAHAVTCAEYSTVPYALRNLRKSLIKVAPKSSRASWWQSERLGSVLDALFALLFSLCRVLMLVRLYYILAVGTWLSSSGRDQDQISSPLLASGWIWTSVFAILNMHWFSTIVSNVRSKRVQDN